MGRDLGEPGVPAVSASRVSGMELIIVAGTRHFAACSKRARVGFILVYEVQRTRVVTHHNFPERPCAEHIKNFVLLLLCETGGLREERIRKF